MTTHEKQALCTRLAALAQLSLTEEEQRTLPDDMAAMVAFADRLKAAAADDVTATAYVVPQVNVFRDDSAAQEWPREALLANAPTKQDGYITVPRVVEG